MSGNLRSQRINNTYGRLLQVANANEGVDGELRPVRDGKGDATPLQLSTTAARIDGPLTVTGPLNVTTTVGSIPLTVQEKFAALPTLGEFATPEAAAEAMAAASFRALFDAWFSAWFGALPTSLPASAGQWWNNSGTLSRS